MSPLLYRNIKYLKDVIRIFRRIAYLKYTESIGILGYIGESNTRRSIALLFNLFLSLREKENNHGQGGIGTHVLPVSSRCANHCASYQ